MSADTNLRSLGPPVAAPDPSSLAWLLHDFTDEEKAKVAQRTKELIEEEEEARQAAKNT